MFAEARLHDIAHLVRNLLDCTVVALSLDCCVPALRHPLVDIFAATIAQCCTPVSWCDGSSEPFAFLSDKQVRNFQADALQMGIMQYTNQFQVEEVVVGSVAVLPLRRPMGMLGCLVCASTCTEAFLEGECQMIGQFLPILSRRVEEIMCEMCVVGDGQREAARHMREGSVHAASKPRFVDMQEQQTLVSLVGHDLRMPLTAIKGYAGLLQTYGFTDQDQSQADATALTPEVRRRYLDVILEQAQHMEVLISDLLDVSRIQSGRLTLRRTRVDMVLLCQRVAQLMQHRVDQQQAGRYAIGCHTDAQSSLVWADPDRVQQVLMNLVENAVKYSPDGGPIEIRVHTRQASSLITVQDWGIGIPGAYQPSLFQMFTRVEQARDIAGSGLGLYISRKLVEAMGGEIILHSSESQGTSVSFTLPGSVLDVTPSRELCGSQ